MSRTTTIFKSKNGEVWHDGDDFGTYGASHRLCVDMAAEIVDLRQRLAVCLAFFHPPDFDHDNGEASKKRYDDAREACALGIEKGGK